MGDETRRFADRFAAAVDRLEQVAGGPVAKARPRPAGAGRRRRAASDAAEGLAEALDAIEAVYQSGTGALRDWAEARGRVLAATVALRRALADGAGNDLPDLARDLLLLIEVRRKGR